MFLIVLSGTTVWHPAGGILAAVGVSTFLAGKVISYHLLFVCLSLFVRKKQKKKVMTTLLNETVLL